MDEFQELRELFVRQLSQGPFPTDDCATAKLGPELHGDLVIYLANIAGIASRGESLQGLDEATRASFKIMAAKSWWEKHPETTVRINSSATPRLFRLISETEEARTLILNELNR